MIYIIFILIASFFWVLSFFKDSDNIIIALICSLADKAVPYLLWIQVIIYVIKLTLYFW